MAPYLYHVAPLHLTSSQQVNSCTENKWRRLKERGWRTKQNFSRPPRASPRAAPVLLFSMKLMKSVESKQIFANATFSVVLLRSEFCWFSLEVEIQSLLDFQWCLESSLVQFSSTLWEQVVWKSLKIFCRKSSEGERTGWAWLASGLSVQSGDSV